MKKVLIVEDNDYRIEFIRSLLNGFEITVTKDVEHGISELKARVYDLVFLDHDFENFILTGTYLAKKWYNDKANFKTVKPIIVIHSMNIEKTMLMENFLKSIASKLIKIPFKFLNEKTLQNEGIK